MSIAFLGDIHGNFRQVDLALQQIPDDVPLIQVGDFGIWPHYRSYWLKAVPRRKIYFIEGNHECHPLLQGLTEPTELWPNAIYVPRGTVLELGGHQVGFLGGAHSVDYKSRTPGFDWFPELEAVTERDTSLLRGHKIDILVTHTAPKFIIDKYCDPQFLVRMFNLSPNYVDPSTVLLEDLWEVLGKPQLVCGHLHRRITDNNIKVLDINELWIYND
jgi:hypothetical protein